MGWRQGEGEQWYAVVWQPFWSQLDDRERARYLDIWDAPGEWREFLLPSPI
jgi:hypothetical protein